MVPRLSLKKAIPNIVNSDGILTDLSYLDDLLGGPDAVGYQVEVV